MKISVEIRESEVKYTWHSMWPTKYRQDWLTDWLTDWLHATGTRLADKSKSEVCKGTSVHMLIYNTSLRFHYNKTTGGRMRARAVTTWLTRGWGKCIDRALFHKQPRRVNRSECTRIPVLTIWQLSAVCYFYFSLSLSFSYLVSSDSSFL